MTERGGRVGLVPVLFEDEVEEDSEITEDEKAWESLFHYVAGVLADQDDGSEFQLWEGPIGEQSKVGEPFYFLRFEALDIDELCNPAILMLNLYENGMHAYQAFAMADWDDEGRVNIIIPASDPEISFTAREFSLAQLTSYAREVVGITVLENLDEDINRTWFNNPNGVAIPAFSEPPASIN